MPTYEYECNNCKLHFELLQGINDSPVKNCPKCGGSVRRLISGGAGLIFKGSGFYITDYQKTSLPKEEKRPELNKPPEKPKITQNKD